MFSVFSSQEQIELFVVNNIHRSFDPENAYAREQLDTWGGGGGGVLVLISHKHILKCYRYTRYWKVIINLTPN